jgi:hypothetical protein
MRQDPAVGTVEERALIVRRIARLARERSQRSAEAGIRAVRRVSAIGRASLEERTRRLVTDLESQLHAHAAAGAPPPLIRLAGRSDDEKPYNRYLGWLFDPSSGHHAARPALIALAQALDFDALCADLADEALYASVR